MDYSTFSDVRKGWIPLDESHRYILREKIFKVLSWNCVKHHEIIYQHISNLPVHFQL